MLVEMMMMTAAKSIYLIKVNHADPSYHSLRCGSAAAHLLGLWV